MRHALTFSRLSLALALGLASASCGGSSPPEPSKPCGEPGDICPVMGTGEQTFNGDGQPPEQTALNLPSVARRGPDGRLYVMDFNNYRLRCVVDAGVVESVAGSGVHAYATVDIDALDSPLENPIDFGFLPDGRIVMVSLHDPRVLRIDDDGTLVSIAGTGEVGDAGDGGPAGDALFAELASIAVAPDGTTYVSDDEAHRIRIIHPDGTIDTYAGVGEKGDDGDGGPAVEAHLNHPQGLALDADGNLYVADNINHRIRRIDAATGVIETVAGTGQAGDSGDGGPATSAQLRFPSGLAVGGDGTLYVADTFNHRIRRVGQDGIIETIAGSTKGYAGDGGPAVEASLKGPAYLEAEASRLYVADQQNQVVRVIHLAQQAGD